MVTVRSTMGNRLSRCKNHNSTSKCTRCCRRPLSRKGSLSEWCAMVGDGGVSGISLSEELSVNERNGEDENPFVPSPPNELRARITQELNELQAISVMIDSRLDNIGPAHIPISPPVLFEQLLDDFMNPPDELVMDDSESDTKSYETPPVLSFLDFDDESDDREVINELNEYGNTGIFFVIMEYLVNISKRHAFWSLNKDILKINNSDNQYAVSIKEDMAYPCLHSPKTTKETSSIRRIQRIPILHIQDIVCENSGRYQAWMDDANITIEEYISLEEEKDRKRGKVFNWETAKISFDDSDDEDYTVIFDKNSFSYKKISTNDLKTDSENDNEKVNLPSLPSPEPAISCFDDLDFFKDFENEFSAIIYNDAQTSKSDLLTESILSPQRIDEFDLNGETSLSEYDEYEQNVLYFNDLFPMI
ncbi:hypothetical protein Tco_0613339 [Tanacetum coccineum]